MIPNKLPYSFKEVIILSAVVILIIVASSLVTSGIVVAVVVTQLKAQRGAIHKRKQILLEGIPAKAMIRAVHPTSSAMDDNPAVTLELTVTQQDGQTFPVVVKTYIPLIHIPQFQESKEIDVKYMEDGNGRSVEVVGAYIP